MECSSCRAVDYAGGSCSIREAFCGQRRRAWLSALGRCVPGMLRLACTGAARRVQQRGGWRAAALPGRVWRGNGAVAMPPALRRSGSAPGMQGLRRQLLSTSAADDAEDGAGRGASSAIAEDSADVEVAPDEPLGSVDDADEDDAAGADDADDADGEDDGDVDESAGPAAPTTFAELMATVDQLRGAGSPLEATAAALLLKAVAPQRVLTDQQVNKAKQVLELIEQDELTMSNRHLQNLLSKLRQKIPRMHVHQQSVSPADLACTLTDAFFASGTAVDVDSYNLLLQVVLRHDVQKCVKVAGTMSEFPGVYANQQTFGIVIEACTRTKRLEEAIGFVNQMRKMRYSPRPVMLIKLLELCYLENNAEAARVCLDVLDQQAQRRGITLDDGSVIQLANLAARTGSIELLADLNNHLSGNSSGPNPTIAQSGAFLNATLHCASSAAQLETCFAAIEDMVSLGITADQETMLHAARSISVDEETIDDSYYTVEARHTNGEQVSVDSLNLVIFACAQLGCVDHM